MTDCNLPLASARAEIDRIDDQILALVERRLDAARTIARAKAGDPYLKLRPRRQAEVVARLQQRARTASPGAIHDIWCELIGHSLAAQAPVRLLIAGAGPPELIVRLREAFGSAPVIEQVASAAEALRRAAAEEAVAVLVHPPAELPRGLLPIARLESPGGEPLALVVGRIAPDEALQPADENAWSPTSWRGARPAQMPIYADAAELRAVEARLSAAAPVVGARDAAALRERLADVAQGRAFLLQAGDCAESFAAFSPDKVRADRELLLVLGRSLQGEVVHVIRGAGQYAKPRSSAVESRDGAVLPVYRGDAVNGAGATQAERRPDPQRLIEAHRLSRASARLLAAHDAVDALLGRDAAVWTSHEALLLPYEEALTRRDPEGRCWALSGHMIWIGDRTRDLDGAHVEYARGVANAVGLKCGPTLGADALLRLVERLDPANEAGRLVLIGRFGAEAVGRHLPALVRATRAEGRNVIWACDPMHGNTRSIDGRKTRRLTDIAAEAASFRDIADAEGIHWGGLHLEAASSPVTECLGPDVAEARLGERYETLCDPRLNPAQAAALLDALHRRAATASDAA